MKRTGAGGLIQIIILIYPPTLYFMQPLGKIVIARFFAKNRYDLYQPPLQQPLQLCRLCSFAAAFSKGENSGNKAYKNRRGEAPRRRWNLKIKTILFLPL